ncbi:MAG: VCBS repeat-containing protein, partial [Candidatus Lambdaproteobacteria bacterium]
LVVIHEGVDKQSNAILIQTILDVGNNAAPEFVDIDNDGDFDLLIGSKDGHIFHYENRGNKLSPRFFRKTPIYMGLKFGGNSVPRLADVNGDRTYDLLVGTGSGKIHIFFNSGMAQEAVFCQAFKVSDPPDKRCKFQPELVADIAPQANAVPELVDWDQDNDLDLVVGKSNGKINYYLNTGNNFAPLWSLKSRHFQFIDGGGSVAPTFHDLNQDGFPELFLGTSSSKIIYYENHEVLLDLLRKIPAIQLENIDISASFEKVLSQACSQLRGLPECLVPLAVAFGVPEGSKIDRMVELYPFILRPDLSIKSNSDKSEADTSKQQNSVVNANIQDDNKQNPENAITQADQATAAGESETEKDVITEKINKLTSQGIITRNQLWLSSRNFLKIENLIGSDRHSFLTSGDWNQDGRIDILLGSRSGEIFAFENRADKSTDWYELKFPVLENNKRQYSSPVLS